MVGVCYLVTPSVTVLDADKPILGFTVTVTVQEPTLSPRRVDLDTLQYRADCVDTLNDTTDPVLIVNLAYWAIDVAATVFVSVNSGESRIAKVRETCGAASHPDPPA